MTEKIEKTLNSLKRFSVSPRENMNFSNRPVRLEGVWLVVMWTQCSGTFGSEYGLKTQPGDILLLEDSCKNAEVVEKNFSACLLNGIFDQVSAIILGKYEKFDDQGTGVKPIEILQEVLSEAKKEIPIVYDVDFSHTKPMLIVELNKPIIIDGKKQRIIKPSS